MKDKFIFSTAAQTLIDLTMLLLGQSQFNEASATELRGYSGTVRDATFVHFPVSLTEGSLTPAGLYYVRFRRVISNGTPQWDSAGFTIANGRITTTTWSQASFLGANDTSGDGAETSLTCEGAVYAVVDGDDPVVGTASAGGFSCTGRHLTNSFTPVTNNINLNVSVIINRCTSLKKPGTSDAQLDDLNATFNLGTADFGNAQGHLQILSPDPHPDLCTPKLLNAVTPAPAFEVLEYEYSSNPKRTYVRQVLGPMFLLQVTHDSEDGSQYFYKINFHYLPSPLTTNQDGFYAIPTNSVPFKVITVENPNGTTNYNTLLITETTDSATNQTKYVYDPAALTWTLELPGALSRHELETVSSSSTEVVERKSIYKPATPDELIYSERNRYSILEE